MKKINKNSMYGQVGSTPKPNRSERRRIQRESNITKDDFKTLDKMSRELAIQEEVKRRMVVFVDYFYLSMRQNRVSAKRGQKIIDDTADLIINNEGVK